MKIHASSRPHDDTTAEAHRWTVEATTRRLRSRWLDLLSIQIDDTDEDADMDVRDLEKDPVYVPDSTRMTEENFDRLADETEARQSRDPA